MIPNRRSVNFLSSLADKEDVNSSLYAHAVPGFGKGLAVFVTAFVLGFGPCLPGGSGGFVPGVQQAQAANMIISDTNTTFSGNVTGDLHITTTGKWTAAGKMESGNGAAANVSGNVLVEGTVNLTDNSAANTGGAIYTNGSVSIRGTGNTTFTDNSAHTDGGAIYANGSVTINGGTNRFQNNKASGRGGGIYAGTGGVIISNGANTFNGNSASTGGAIYAAGSNVTLDGGINTFQNNVTQAGGTLYTTKAVTINGGTNTFQNNKVTNGSGGSIYAWGNVTISGGTNTFTGNSASSSSSSNNGGAIYSNGNVAIKGTGNTTFTGNSAASGGAIYTNSGDITLTPGDGASIRFVTASDSLYAKNLTINGTGQVIFNSTNNIISGDNVEMQSGTTSLTQGSTFDGVKLNITGGTLHMGVAAPRASTVAAGISLNGAGTAAPFATNLKGFHLGDGTTLSLDMNLKGNADVAYFALASGYAATSGTNTTVYGVIGRNLIASSEATWTYTLFTGSNGAPGDFNPTNYYTSSALVSLTNPVYDKGTFTFDVVRNNQPAPNPDSVPIVTGDFMGLFPQNSLERDMEMILYYDYFYNGGTIANPGPGTLIGRNAFMDRLMLVLPNGQNAFTPEQRLLALESAASMADMSASMEMLRDTGNRLRGQIFATDAVRNNRAAMTKINDGAQLNLWATPTYSHETGNNRGQYGSLDSGYRYNMYGGMIGLDALLADGKFRMGGVFSVSRGKLDSRGDGFSTTNDADSVGGALFGAWLPTPEWEIGIYTSYIDQKNDVEQDNILNLKSMFDTSLWQIGTNVQYSTIIGNDGKRKLTAGGGVDALMYKRDSHSISANGEDIANMGKSDLNQVQIPLSVGIQDTFDFANGSSLTVDGRLGYRLTLGNLTTKSDWSIPGGSHTARISGPNADRNTALVGVGALWRKDQLSIGLTYDAEIGQKRTNHQLSGQVRWAF